MNLIQHRKSMNFKFQHKLSCHVNLYSLFKWLYSLLGFVVLLYSSDLAVNKNWVHIQTDSALQLCHISVSFSFDLFGIEHISNFGCILDLDCSNFLMSCMFLYWNWLIWSNPSSRSKKTELKFGTFLLTGNCEWTVCYHLTHSEVDMLV